jgi:hypothetical protein
MSLLLECLPKMKRNDDTDLHVRNHFFQENLKSAYSHLHRGLLTRLTIIALGLLAEPREESLAGGMLVWEAHYSVSYDPGKITFRAIKSRHRQPTCYQSVVS